MSEPRQIGTVRSYDDLLALCRRQVGALGITYTILDDVTCFTDSYASKLLGHGGITRAQVNGKLKRGTKRGMGPDAFDAYLAALCFDLVAVENKEKVAKLRLWLKRKLEGRRGPIMVRRARAKPLSMADFKSILRELGRKGGNARVNKIAPEKRTRIARKAARARWSKPRVTAVLDTSHVAVGALK